MVLAMLCVAGTAGAQTVESDLTADMFKTWSTTDGNASVTGDATIDFNVGNEISNGGVLCGTSSVDGFVYADLSEYTKILQELRRKDSQVFSCVFFIIVRVKVAQMVKKTQR